MRAAIGTILTAPTALVASHAPLDLEWNTAHNATPVWGGLEESKRRSNGRFAMSMNFRSETAFAGSVRWQSPWQAVWVTSPKSVRTRMASFFCGVSGSPRTRHACTFTAWRFSGSCVSRKYTGTLNPSRPPLDPLRPSIATEALFEDSSPTRRSKPEGFHPRAPHISVRDRLPSEGARPSAATSKRFLFPVGHDGPGGMVYPLPSTDITPRQHYYEVVRPIGPFPSPFTTTLLRAQQRKVV